MKSHIWWVIGGVVAMIGGVLALLNPFAASLAANFLAGWSFLIMGALALVALFGMGTTGQKVMMGLFGLLALMLGVSLIANPLAGLLTLTFLAGALILASGITRLVLAFRLRGSEWFWLTLMSGGISVMLGFMILSDYPASAASILGIFLGVELIFNGISMFSMASLAKKVEGVFDAVRVD